jgi:hypothetical protein
VLDSLERLLQRMRDKPEHAAHFAQKTAGDLANSLGNYNGRMIICHVRGEVASLRDVEKDKVDTQRRDESFRHRLAEPFTFGFVNPRGPFFRVIVVLLL